MNQIYNMFTNHVRETRGGHIADDTMQGQTFLAPEAMERGLIDGIVNDKWDVIAEF